MTEKPLQTFNISSLPRQDLTREREGGLIKKAAMGTSGRDVEQGEGPLDQTSIEPINQDAPEKKQ